MMKIPFLLLTLSGIFLISARGQSSFPEPKGMRLLDSVDCTSVKDQGSSPTCWAFGTNSVFESDLIKQYGTRLNLSEMFIARYAYLDKAKQYLATGGKTYFEGGGQFHDVIRVIRSAGMMPDEVYTGKPGEQYSHNHSGLDTAMKKYVHGLLHLGKKNLSEWDLQNLTDTLDKYLGKPPASFYWKGRIYTARSFADEILHFKDDYLELVSFADNPFYKRFVLEDKYNWANDSFWNISLADMQQITDTALARGWSVGWEGDITEPGFNYLSGYASMPDSNYQFDRQRIDNYKTEVTERDHMLHLAGMGYDASGKKWYYLKNSWGTWLSRFKGYLYMEENYFRMKTVILFVNKKALPEGLLKKLGIGK